MTTYAVTVTRDTVVTKTLYSTLAAALRARKTALHGATMVAMAVVRGTLAAAILGAGISAHYGLDSMCPSGSQITVYADNSGVCYTQGDMEVGTYPPGTFG